MEKNAWPCAEKTKDLEPAFKHLGRLVSDIALLLAKHCDAFIRDTLPTNTQLLSIHDILENSHSAKGRLLHYFAHSHSSININHRKYTTTYTSAPSGEGCNDDSNIDTNIDTNGEIQVDDSSRLWCGFHNDHCLLTGLVPAQYFGVGGEASNQGPDEQCGLYVVPRTHDNDESSPSPSHSQPPGVLKVRIPPDCLAFQIGECAQIASGGILHATAHGVRAPRATSGCVATCRVLFAVFLQPDPWVELSPPIVEGRCWWADGVDGSLASSPLVPALSARYSEGDTFAEFSEKTFTAYY